MGYRIVRVTGEIFQMLFTEGYTLPTREGHILRVTNGLPEGAKFEGLSHELFFDQNCWAIKFSHPSWPEQKPGEAIPVLDVRFSIEEPDPAVLVAPGLTPEDVEHLRRELEKAPRGRLVAVPLRAANERDVITRDGK